MQIDSKNAIEPAYNYSKEIEGKYMPQDNIIFAQSDALRVFTIIEDFSSAIKKPKLILKTEFALND